MQRMQTIEASRRNFLKDGKTLTGVVIWRRFYDKLLLPSSGFYLNMRENPQGPQRGPRFNIKLANNKR
jgi:hypothetical protein